MTNNIINKKWTLQILFLLNDSNQHSYKSIKHFLNIPNSTLALRLTELTKHNYLTKYIYGSTSMPHLTEYKITDTGLDSINNIIGTTKQ